MNHVALARPSRWCLLTPKAAFGPVGTVVGKTWLACSCHCVSIQTQVPFTFSFYMNPMTNDEGPGCYLRLSKIGPAMGPRLSGHGRSCWVVIW